MRKLTIRLRLFLGFGLLTLIFVAVGIYAIVSLNSINSQAAQLGTIALPSIDYAHTINTNTSDYKITVLGHVNASSNTEKAKKEKQLSDLSNSIADAIAKYSLVIISDEDKALMDTIKTQWDQYAQQCAQIIELSKKAKSQEAMWFMSGDMEKIYISIAETCAKLVAFNQQQAENMYTGAQAVYNQASVTLIAALILAIIIAIAGASVIISSIIKPVSQIEGVFSEMSKGNMQVNVSYDGQDEIGSMAKSIRKTNKMLSSYIGDISDKLGLLAEGDLRFDVSMDYIGDFAAIKQAIQKTVKALNHTLQTINTAAEQVSTGAEQVSSGAQALAAGSSEQASSVEELSASVDVVARQAAVNSKSIQAAAQYVLQAGTGVSASNDHMGHLTEAMREIDTASSQITNITKVIEDIAFQTNILALNAAIEAARAGNAGKGFAVVADEVRNLAGKSAAAAKQTAELIHSSVASVGKGTRITTQTADILQEVSEKTQMVTASIEEIERASIEQAQAIDQIKTGLNQVSAVVQTNAATAEENSATSEEMSAQASTLRDEVTRFKLSDGRELML